jgi:phospholipase/carboxylesterase
MLSFNGIQINLLTFGKRNNIAMHEKNIKRAGRKIEEAKKAMILLHGRGATADDILTLKDHLNLDEFAILAPQATQYTWYPYSFLAPVNQNEPWLSSALSMLGDVVADLHKHGFTDDRIYFAGFSQGACLTLEFTTRNARRWGGVIAFTGGLIGDKLNASNYKGDFNKTPVFIGTSDPDPHVPVERVEASVGQLNSMNASVNVKIYPSLGHTISQDEISQANKLVLS